MESDEEEKINQKKIEEQNILTEEEIIDTLDMSIYKERIENIIGKQYSYLYFDYFENIYHSKIKNKISFPLSEYLHKDNNTNDTYWMQVYKSLKFYSRDNLPIIISKYFNLKAETEFKFLYNESKKYTNNSYKFFDIYLKKMKKANQKKLNEFKMKNPNLDIFELQKKQNHFVRAFISKKTIIRPKLSIMKNKSSFKNNPIEEDSDLSNKEKEIKNKKEMRIQIMRKIHQLKINTIKEIEKANILQNKQKKKYGSIKSRFLDAYNQQENFFKIINSKSSRKLNKNNLYKNKLTEIEDTYPYPNHSTSTKKKINNSSKNSSKTYLYLNTKENNFSSRKNLNLKLFPEESKYNNYYLNSQSNTSKKNLKINYFRNDKTFYNNLLELRGLSAKKKSSKKKLNLYEINKENENKLKPLSNLKVLLISKIKLFNSDKKFNKFKFKGSSKFSKLNSLSKKNNFSNNAGIFIKNLEKKRNKEILENLKEQNNNNNEKEKQEYNNIIYNIFKRTEVF